MAETRWLTEREDEVWRDYLRMQRELTARLEQELQAQSGLSTADYEVLVNLSEAPDHRLRAFELCDAMRWEKSRLSHHLSRMERRGLVRREECSTDGRGADVVLTRQGRTAITKAAPRHVDAVRALFLDPLTRAQLDQLAAISHRVLDGLGGDRE